MGSRWIALGILLVALPAVAQAVPVGGEFYGYWSEAESLDYISLSNGSYEISGRYVAVMTYEEQPGRGNHALIGELFDCSEMQYARSEQVDYDADNREISNYSSNNLTKSFGPIEEDTRQEFLLIGICDEESGQPYDLARVRNYFKMIAASLEASERLLSR